MLQKSTGALKELLMAKKSTVMSDSGLQFFEIVVCIFLRLSHDLANW